MDGGGPLEMSIRKYKPEQIITVLRQIEVQTANGKPPLKPARKLEFTPRRTIAGEKSTVD